jgi:hexosaminidase
MGLCYSNGSYRIDINTSFNEANNSAVIDLLSEQISPEIHYTLDNTTPTNVSPLFTKPLTINTKTTIRAAIFLEGKLQGAVSEKTISLNKATGKSVIYTVPPSNKYRAGGNLTLVNGIIGSANFSDGQWQGFEGNDLEIIIDLGAETKFSHISESFISAPGSWIFLPQYVEFFISSDGNSFTSIGKAVNKKLPADQTTERITLNTDNTSVTARYVKVFAKNLGVCPEGHVGAGKKAWMFTDEIVIE